MIYHFHIYLYIFILIGLFQKTDADLIEAKLIPIPQMNKSEIVIDYAADLAHKEKVMRERKTNQFLQEFTPQEDKELLEESFAQAPIKIKVLVHCMLRGDDWALRFKNILLTGPSGSGKSTLAQAIAYKLNRKCIVIDAPKLLGHYRDQAAENIRQLFKEVAESKDKPVLIIDEINALTDGHTSEHSDTKHTAMQLWTLLDKYKNDKDFLFIGTTNITKKMPHQLQSRFQGKTYYIDNPSLEARRKSIQFCIKKFNARVDKSLDDKYLDELAQKTTNFSIRAIESLIDLSLHLCAIQNPDAPVKKITKESLEQAYSEMIEDDNKIWDFSEHMSEEEKRHRENLEHSKKQFEENKNFQMKLAEWNLVFQSLMKG